MSDRHGQKIGPGGEDSSDKQKHLCALHAGASFVLFPLIIGGALCCIGIVH